MSTCSQLIHTLKNGGYDPALAALYALDGGQDGLVFYRRILEGSGEYLNAGGKLFLEIGYDQAEAVGRLMEQAGFQEIRTKKDYSGHDRVVWGTLGFPGP